MNKLQLHLTIYVTTTDTLRIHEAAVDIPCDTGSAEKFRRIAVPFIRRTRDTLRRLYADMYGVRIRHVQVYDHARAQLIRRAFAGGKLYVDEDGTEHIQPMSDYEIMEAYRVGMYDGKVPALVISALKSRIAELESKITEA